MNVQRYCLTRFLLSLLALPALAGSLQLELPSEPPSGLAAAWFHDDCAPWDGSATSLYLGAAPAKVAFEPGFPFLQVSLYSNSQSLRRDRLHFEVSGNKGYAQYCQSKEECKTATSVTIEFSKAERDLLEGRLEILFKDRPAIRGGFLAKRLPFRALCG
jgi:hypothetical protein